VVQRLNEAITRIATVADTRAAWARQAVDPMPMSPAEFCAFLERDIRDQAEVIRVANIWIG
jgi:tripartite-type tricarboxylate transporter receptor subunit TctC